MSRTATAATPRSGRAWKAAAAAGAATVLLIGGGATFAEWSDSSTVDSEATIASGQLRITSPETGAWTSAAGPIEDISTYRVVPGDVLTYREALTITAEGDQLTATVDTTLPALAETNELARHLTTGATMTLNGSDVGADLSAQVVATGEPQTLDVAITVVFDETTADRTAQGQSVNLADLAVQLKQDLPTADAGI